MIASSVADPVATNLRDDDGTGRRWLDLAVAVAPDVYTSVDYLQVRVVNLKTKRVPTPAGATAVTVTGLHSASMFAHADDGSLAMDVPYVPQLTIFEFRAASATGAPRRHWPARRPPMTQAASRALPQNGRRASLKAGPGRSDCVRSRTSYTHDRDAMVPDEAEDAVEHFLFESRRGPDYLSPPRRRCCSARLATTPAVRSGFYASPERRSHNARLTQVLAEDAHFWVEVRSRNGRRTTENGDRLSGVWLTVEPTPGLRPPLRSGVIARLAAA